MKTCVRCLVSGRVQGVCFRAATRQQAERLGITGYARNLPDGRVEVMASGQPEAVAELKTWLMRGPPQARVSAVSSEIMPPQDYSSFSVG